MKNYEVTVARHETKLAKITVAAESEDLAGEKAVQMASESVEGIDWELDDEDHDLIEVVEL